MSTLIDTPITARLVKGNIEIDMASGQKLSFPIASNPKLAVASDEQLANIEISPFGIHWPDLDEDLSIRGIIDGKFC